jgi:DNA-binding HxlR family transcriptional regulator
MTRRNYGQACSLAGALDRIGERWSLLIVRELLLGPLRFSDLDRAVGGAPTDVLTKRLRDLERDGIIERRKLDPPASSVAYELTELGRGLERPILELARWGLNFSQVEDVDEIEASWLPNSLRILLQPPPEVTMSVQLRSDGNSFRLRIADGWISAERGEVSEPDLLLAGEPRALISALVFGESGEGEEATIEGDPEALAQLREMITLPERLHEEALGEFAATARKA